MKKADPLQTANALYDAHHIVARLHFHAERAREILFAWGIAINDAANGVFLPRNMFIRHILDSNATPHQILHTTTYYLEVTLRLLDVGHESADAVRAVLNDIRQELLAGAFPY